jgi:four helix bundle protein
LRKVLSCKFSVLSECKNKEVQDFRKLKVWEKGHALTLAVYKETVKFPREEQYGLTSQIRRASASIPANIAEGCGRGGKAELGQFLRVAMGSASEVEYHLLLARDLGYLDISLYGELDSKATEVKRMLASLIVKVRA